MPGLWMIEAGRVRRVAWQSTNLFGKRSRACPSFIWEDFTPGRVFEHGPRRVAARGDHRVRRRVRSAADASRRGGGAQTMLGGLGASGWYACCILMRMCADGFVLNSSSMGAPGVDEVRWLLPIRPDDELRLRATVLETRASKSRPDMGFVRFEFELFNAGGDRVMTLTTSLMMGRRDAGRVMKFFEDIAVGERAELGRTPSPPTRSRRSRALRSAAVSSRRGGGGALALRRAVRLGLAHGVDLDAADGRAPAPRGRGAARARRAGRDAWAVARLSRAEVAQAGLCRRHHHLFDGDRRNARFQQPARLGSNVDPQHRASTRRASR